jgi:hypothetical protein
MVRKSTRKFTKRYIKKCHKKRVTRKYKGGLTPTPKGSKSFKKKTGKFENFGFKMQPLVLGNNSTGKKSSSFGFPMSSPKSLKCNSGDTSCIEMKKEMELQHLIKIAEEKKPHTPISPSAIEARELFKKNRRAAKENPQAYEHADAAEWKKALGKKALEPVNLNQKTIEYYLTKKK